MKLLPSLSQAAKTLRVATLLLAAMLGLSTASGSDALTTVTSAATSSSTTSTRTGLLRSLFGSKSSSSSSTSTSSSSQLSRSILGLPIGILKSAVSVVTKAASSTVTEHIKKN